MRHGARAQYHSAARVGDAALSNGFPQTSTANNAGTPCPGQSRTEAAAARMRLLPACLPAGIRRDEFRFGCTTIRFAFAVTMSGHDWLSPPASSNSSARRSSGLPSEESSAAQTAIRCRHSASDPRYLGLLHSKLRSRRSCGRERPWSCGRQIHHSINFTGSLAPSHPMSCAAVANHRNRFPAALPAQTEALLQPAYR